MNAEQLADELDAPIGKSGRSTYSVATAAAAMLRKQAEAIRQLRDALENLERCSGLASMWDDEGRKAARAALAATEEFQK